jgi:hypothetical protein
MVMKSFNLQPSLAGAEPRHFGRILLIILLVLLFAGLGAFTSWAVYKLVGGDVDPKQCTTSANMVVAEELSCRVQGAFNIYPGALFAADTPAVVFGATPGMTIGTCAEECGAAQGCVCFTCGVDADAGGEDAGGEDAGGEDAGGGTCTCTGYQAYPNQLQMDNSAECVGNGACNVVGVKSSALSGK